MSDSNTTLSRRKFLKIVLPTSGLVATGLVAYITPRETARALYDTMDPELSSRAPESLPAKAAESMTAFAEALCRVPIVPGRYRSMYEWRSEHIPGHHSLYVRFATELDRVASERGARSFADLAVDERISFSDDLRDVELREAEKLWATVGNRDWILFNRVIVEDTLRLFANTDLWTHVGYDSHPGHPRGLTSYTQPLGD